MKVRRCLLALVNSVVNYIFKGIDCGIFGRAVASNTRKAMFEYTQQQNMLEYLYCKLFKRKNGNRGRQAAN